MRRRKRPTSNYEPKSHKVLFTMLILILCILMFGIGWFATRPILMLFGFV